VRAGPLTPLLPPRRWPAPVKPRAAPPPLSFAFSLFAGGRLSCLFRPPSFSALPPRAWLLPFSRPRTVPGSRLSPVWLAPPRARARGPLRAGCARGALPPLPRARPLPPVLPALAPVPARQARPSRCSPLPAFAPRARPPRPLPADLFAPAPRLTRCLRPSGRGPCVAPVRPLRSFGVSPPRPRLRTRSRWFGAVCPLRRRRLPRSSRPRLPVSSLPPRRRGVPPRPFCPLPAFYPGFSSASPFRLAAPAVARSLAAPCASSLVRLPASPFRPRAGPSSRISLRLLRLSPPPRRRSARARSALFSLLLASACPFCALFSSPQPPPLASAPLSRVCSPPRPPPPCLLLARASPRFHSSCRFFPPVAAALLLRSLSALARRPGAGPSSCAGVLGRLGPGPARAVFVWAAVPAPLCGLCPQ